MRTTGAAPTSTPGGFTLVELLVVAGVVALLSAVLLPSIVTYLRHGQIRAAATEVSGTITTARTKAIMKTANFGVAFLTMTSTTYRYVLEDDQTPPVSGTRLPLTTVIADPAQIGPLQTLPGGVRFDTGCSGFGTATDPGFRFNRLGAWCDPSGTNEPCPALGVGTSLVANGSAGGRICLLDTASGLRRQITVTPGGRVTSTASN